MVSQPTKLRFRRIFKRRRKQAEEIGQQAEQGLEKHLFKRLPHIVGVRRFIFTWVALLCLLTAGVIVQTRGLSRFYQTEVPIAGGTYKEGIMGSFTNANPLYATGSVDASVARLVFSSLMQYDSNNILAGDLATKLEVNDRASVYTVHLRKDAVWHDGKPVTSEDVVFTYQTIQNPDAKSPLLPNWQNIKIEAKDAYTIVFTLPHSLASFPHSLTNGIVPKHLLSDIPASSLRSIAFNTANPVGSGPFVWSSVQVSGDNPQDRQEQIGLAKNEKYYKGAPKLDQFIIKTFRSEDDLASSIQKREFTAAAGLDTVPVAVENSSNATEYSVPLMGEVAVFLRNSSTILQDTTVRKALTKATNVNDIMQGLGYPTIKAHGPLLKSHVGFDKTIVQPGYNLAEARTMLDQAGWNQVNEDGIRVKNGQELSLRMFSKSSSQYTYVTGELQQQWRDVGVKLEVILQTDEDLQSTIAFHNYDVLLYGIAIGSDPDVYAYWHSSQADPRSSSRLNLSEYKSSVVDQALEGGRSRVDPGLRAVKYKPLLEKWRDEAPAIALYQPRFLYITTDKVHGFAPIRFNTSTDRFANVHDWAIREAKATIE